MYPQEPADRRFGGRRLEDQIHVQVRPTLSHSGCSRAENPSPGIHRNGSEHRTNFVLDRITPPPRPASRVGELRTKIPLSLRPRPADGPDGDDGSVLALPQSVELAA